MTKDWPAEQPITPSALTTMILSCAPRGCMREGRGRHCTPYGVLGMSHGPTHMLKGGRAMGRRRREGKAATRWCKD